MHHLDAVHPGVERMLVSARTGAGLDAWRDWLAARVTRTEVPT
jgi:hydrogenase nickel incorporation protein HypB